MTSLASNILLDMFPSDSRARLAPHFKHVTLEQKQVLHHPGEVIEDVYFPLTCLLSITITMQNGATAEVGLVGSRGLLGINAFMESQATTQTEYIVQISGEAIKLDAKLLRDEFNSNVELRDILLRYTQAILAQISQTTACNRLHILEQRFARWLLGAQDLVKSNELALTHGFISDMLGVRRAGVTQAAQKLQERGLIRYRQGRVYILDQAGLEAASCECFRVVKSEYDRLLGRNP